MRLSSLFCRLVLLPGVLSLSAQSAGLSQTLKVEDVVPDWSTENNLEYSYFGFSTVSAGDVDADGYDDILVTTMPVPGASSGKGQMYLYRGGESGPESTPLWTYEAASVRSYLGARVCRGDLNNDGHSDIIISEPRFYTSSGVFQSRVHVFFGSVTGLGDAPGWSVSLDDLTGSWFMPAVGDVNGDGYDDLALGDIGSSSRPGKVHIFYGATVLPDTADLVLIADANFTFFGQAVASRFDVNGDGYDDLAVSEPNYNNARGRIKVFLGSATGLDVTPFWTVVGDGSDEVMGSSLASAGDVNGDGYDDILAVSNSYDAENKPYSNARLYAGAPTAMSTTAVWSTASLPLLSRIVVGTPGDLNTDGLSDIVLGTVTREQTTATVCVFWGAPAGVSALPNKQIGAQQGSEFGMSLSSDGDFNGDGSADLLVGAPLHDNGEVNEGRVMLFYGVPATTDVAEGESRSVFAALAGNILASGAPLSLQVHLLDASVLSVDVVSVTGALLHKYRVELGAGTQRVESALPNSLAAGLYFARLTTNRGERLTLPFRIVP